MSSIGSRRLSHLMILTPIPSVFEKYMCDQFKIRLVSDGGLKPARKCCRKLVGSHRMQSIQDRISTVGVGNPSTVQG